MLKGSITTISYDSNARDEISRQLNHLLGQELRIRSLCCDELDPTQEISDDLILITAPVVRDRVVPKIKPGCKFLVATRTINTSNIKKLFNIPTGSDVIVFNNLLENTIEVVNELQAIGINHINLHPYDFHNPKSLKDYNYAITIGEPHLVPKHIPVSVNLGHRLISIVTIGKILDHFNVSKTLDYLVSSRYLKNLVQLSMELTAQVSQNQTLLQQLKSFISDLEDGVIVTDSKQNILLFNKTAVDLLDLPENTKGKRADIVLPCMEYRKQPCFCTVNNRELYITSGSTGSPDTTMITIKDLSKIQNIDVDYRKQQRKSLYTAKYRFQDILHTSSAMVDLVGKAQKIADSDSSILLIGESGTGKELLAQSIHNASTRSNYPFVAVNCAALNENLLESELFGYKEGAFTGARKGGKKGLFELAHLGSIFLDEIGDAPYSIQTKLLRVLQEREIMQVGGEKIIPIDVRVIAATNKNLNKLVAEGSFRKDLYYRINILPLYVPPLRERQGDIQILLKYFLNKYAGKQGIAVPALDRDTRETLLSYSWPGNIRELEHLAEYISIIYPVTDNLRQDILNHLSGRDAQNAPLLPFTPNEPEGGAILFTTEQIKLEALEILAILQTFRRQGVSLGRGRLRQELQSRTLLLSEQQIKTRLELLQKMGMVKSMVGKGTVILPRGEEYLQASLS